MIWKRRILFFRSPSDLAGTGLTRLPPKLQTGPEGLGLPQETPQHQVVDSNEYVRQTLTALGDGILGDPGDAVLGPLEGTLNLVGYQASVSDSLQAVSHPPQAGPLLVPAVQAVQK